MTRLPAAKHLLRWGVALAVVYGLPYAVLAVAGFLWLYERQWWWVWLVATLALSGAGWGLVRWQRRKLADEKTAGPQTVAPDPRWSPAGQAAWAEVENIAQRAEVQIPAFDQPEVLWNLLKEILEAVAKHFRPGASEPLLEIRVPDVLYITQRVARDLRQSFSDQVPGAHIFTLADLRQLRAWAGTAQQLFKTYRFLLRMARIGTNPLGAVVAELRDATTAGMYHASVDQIKQHLVGLCVRKAGFYAIQLYSGQLVDEETLVAQPSPASRDDIEKAQADEKRTVEEPLRILVLGQIKAGKSSLINALAGQIRAAVEVLPCTRTVQPVLLQREGIPSAILLDTAGFDAAPGAPSPFAAIREEVLRSDLVLLVVPANSASRAPERRLLDDMRAFYLADLRLVMPPLVVVVTHIDRLRPASEWSPPYDYDSGEPTGPKAENIRHALHAIAGDLALTPQQPVVPVCLHPDRVYNVEEGLMAAMAQVVPETSRAKYHRLLREFESRDRLSRVIRQVKNAAIGLLHLRTAKPQNR